MSEKEFSVKGWNYGAAKFGGAVLTFDVGSIPAFEVPLNHVSGCTTGKNEVTLEFHQVRHKHWSVWQIGFQTIII